jgi:indolepyruvate ferredoxin oxidoreductase alpha subunit
MGNEAIAFGALSAGVSVITGYPGTPSSEILETVVKQNADGVYAEWSVNEKAALEVAAGAAFSGLRAMATMKQVGLNVASDPLMSLNYVGVKGGLVVVAADDPGPVSSQTEQDTRRFGEFSKIAVFDPSSPEEAYFMIGEAFEFSERYGRPVLFRPTTRVCHGTATVQISDGVEPNRKADAWKAFGNVCLELAENAESKRKGNFMRGGGERVIFPKLAYENHIEIEAQLKEMSAELSDYPRNFITDITPLNFSRRNGKGEYLYGKKTGAENGRAADTGGIASDCGAEVKDDTTSSGNSENGNATIKKGIASGGVSFAYTEEALSMLPPREGYRLFKVSAYPFPERGALRFLDGLDEALVIEELDPVIERALTELCGRYGVNVKIRGKLTGDAPVAGENSVETAYAALRNFFKNPQKTAESDIIDAEGKTLRKAVSDNILGIGSEPRKATADDTLDIASETPPALPVRPPVLCPGCPHRFSFSAVKQAVAENAGGRKAVFSGDIGCYTLGNALGMVDTCLCMGAGITVAQGLSRAEPDALNFAFIGDSTFFHSGITGLINAVYNQADIIVVILDNFTTAMTGNQPHPGVGKTPAGKLSKRTDIYKIVEAIGADALLRVNAYDGEGARAAVKSVLDKKGVRVLLFEGACIKLKGAE